MEIIDQKLLDSVSEAARIAPRLRKNHNLHRGDDSRCHRLLNGIEPGSYIRPHRHLSPDKDEAFVVVRGVIGVVTFDEQGGILESVRLQPGGAAVAVDIPHGVYHTAIALESGSVFFEAKGGPYLPLAPQELASWSPEEGSHQARLFVDRLTERFR